MSAPTGFIEFDRAYLRVSEISSLHREDGAHRAKLTITMKNGTCFGVTGHPGYRDFAEMERKVLAAIAEQTP